MVSFPLYSAVRGWYMDYTTDIRRRKYEEADTSVKGTDFK